MNKLAQLIADGEITVEELANAKDLIERAELVIKGLEACKQTITFPFGITKVDCYHYVDSAGEYEAWGSCTHDGVFTCYSNWGGEHLNGKCNLTNFSEVFKAFDENDEFEANLNRLLCRQIQRASEM